MKYQITQPQEKVDWCLPTCLQTVFARKEMAISQKEIAEHFRRNPLVGFNCNLNDLNRFLRPYSLESDFYNPFMNLIELDIFLKHLDDESDHLLFYDFYEIIPHSGKDSNHTSIITKYHPRGERVEIWEPESNQVLNQPLNEIIRSIQVARNKDYGIYTINHL